MKCPPTFEDWHANPDTWQQLEPQECVPTVDGKEQMKTKRLEGSVWNGFRKSGWPLTQFGGKPSYLGEIWYAEADEPTGP